MDLLEFYIEHYEELRALNIVASYDKVTKYILVDKAEKLQMLFSQ